MERLKFIKMVAAGNDFILIDNSLVRPSGAKDFSKIAQVLCKRKISIGADGMLVLEKSNKADFKMRIFNSDGSETEMCGNGLRCAVLYKNIRRKVKIETQAGLYEAQLAGKDKVKIKMKGPKDARLGVSIKINERPVKVNYIDTGVPHAVIFVEGLEKIDVERIGRNVRYHSEFKPRGTNVDFAEIIDDKNIKMRTYERGVEGETLACGTGAVASAILANYESKAGHQKVNVHTKGGVLKVYFKKIGKDIKDVYLEGGAKEVYKGEVKYV